MDAIENLTVLRERVRHGIAWLDEHHEHWRDEIDVETLSMDTTCDCVLGQVYEAASRFTFVSGFTFALDEWVGKVEISPRDDAHGWFEARARRTAWAAERGFDLTADDHNRGMTHRNLDTVWKEVLA